MLKNVTTKIFTGVLIICGLIFIPTANLVFADAAADVEKYTAKINANPNNAEAWVNRGMAYLCLENYNQAISDANKAIELDSKNEVAYYIRGCAYVELKKNLSQAMADYNKAISLDPEFAEAYAQRSILDTELNRGEMLNDINKAIALNPKKAYFYLVRWSMYDKLLGDKEKAQADWAMWEKLKDQE